MVTSTIKATTKLSNKKYVVQTMDGGSYLSDASPSTTPSVDANFNSAGFQLIGAGVGTYAVYDPNTPSKHFDITVYVIGTASNTAYAYALQKNANVWTLSAPTKYLGPDTIKGLAP